ncbi:MAG: hypothetical protein PVJ33_13970 [Lysobacterales bacterium]|jgi:hypothetical protein
MKDLYRELGLSRNATSEEIAEALKQHADLADYAKVLLNEQKRVVYDRAHAAVTSIGTLRQRLGLDKESSWFVENYADFSPAARQAPQAATESTSAPPAPATGAAGPSAPAPAGTAQTSSPAKTRRVGRGSLIVLVLAAAALAVILYLALS